MKKIIASTALAVLVAPYASADTTVVTAHEEPAVVVDQTPADECCRPDFGGIGFILGIGGNFLKVKANDPDESLFSKNANRFIGTVGISGGKVFRDKFYVGAEVLLDFTKSKKFEVNHDGAYYSLKSGGLFTSFGLRLGYIIPNYNAMLYFKVAGSHSTAKLYSADDLGQFSVKANKVVPALALGIEKAFCKKFTARLEGEYRFRAKKVKNVEGTDFTIKANDGFTVRALVSYNVRF